MKIRNVMWHIALLVAIALSAGNALAQQISVVPQAPTGRETVKLRVSSSSPFALGREPVSMLNNRLTVTLRSYEDFPDPEPQANISDVSVDTSEVVLGQLPQGNYTADVLLLNRRTSVLTTVGSVQFSISDESAARHANYPAYNYTDLWGNSAESGWGISIHVKSGQMFAAWFAYDASGNPTWYTFQLGSWIAPNEYSSGKIYKTHANPNAGLGPLTQLAVTEAGSGTMVFNGYDRATFTYIVDGLQNNKNIARQVF